MNAVSSPSKNVPVLLAEHQDVILLAGKYWRMLKEAHQSLSNNATARKVLTWDNVGDVIESMVQDASRRVLVLMRSGQHQDLLPALRCVCFLSSLLFIA
jgi:PHD/YefM family antitoxin component YafN of YafNO toxin-antitoxin module